MKKGKILIILICTLVSFEIFTSCDDDGYSLDALYPPELVTVEPVNNSQYILIRNNGSKFFPISGINYINLEERFRGIAYYTIVGDSINNSRPVIVHHITPILTKAPTTLTPATRDSLGIDPIRMLDYAIGDDYLNIYFAIPASAGSVHFINLAKNDTIGKSDYYELLHNGFKQNGPLRTGFVAFDLREIKNTHTTPYEFTLKAQDCNGETKEFKITYNWESTDSQEFLIKDATYNKKIMEVR